MALVASKATVKSGAYSSRLSNCGVTVVSFPCSTFVPFVEQNLVNTPECEEAVRLALGDIQRCNVDTVILGCTHFPVLKNKITPYVDGAKIIECCTDFQPNFCDAKKTKKTLFFTSGVEKQANFASQWFGEIHFLHVDL